MGHVTNDLGRACCCGLIMVLDGSLMTRDNPLHVLHGPYLSRLRSAEWGKRGIPGSRQRRVSEGGSTMVDIVHHFWSPPRLGEQILGMAKFQDVMVIATTDGVYVMSGHGSPLPDWEVR